MMKPVRSHRCASLMVALLGLAPLPAAAQLGDNEQGARGPLRSTPGEAEHLTVSCDDAPKNRIGELLAKLDPEKAHVIRVAGACYENLEISQFRHLTLTTEHGASITDASGGTAPVVYVGDTTRFEMNGFTINGGADGVICDAHSTCLFTDDTFQDSSGYGAFIAGGSRADFVNCVMRSNLRGLQVDNGSTAHLIGVGLLDNADIGAVVALDSLLTAIESTVQGNATLGIRVRANASVRITDSDISGNGSDGLLVDWDSLAIVNGGNTITGNARAGVRIGDSSMAVFFGDDVTGNLGGTDVLCAPQFSATRGALININGGSTNCVEP